MTVADLTARTRLDFGDLAAADTMPAVPKDAGRAAVRRIETRDDIVADESERGGR